MRQWNVNPREMCRQHLLGEHCELHMFVGTINRNKRIDGFINTGLVETGTLRRRHQELVREMKRRGMHHNSPLPEFKIKSMGKVDREQSREELARRCYTCRILQQRTKATR